MYIECNFVWCTEWAISWSCAVQTKTRVCDNKCMWVLTKYICMQSPQYTGKHSKCCWQLYLVDFRISLRIFYIYIYDEHTHSVCKITWLRSGPFYRTMPTNKLSTLDLGCRFRPASDISSTLLQVFVHSAKACRFKFEIWIVEIDKLAGYLYRLCILILFITFVQNTLAI